MLFINFLCLLYLMVFADSHTISKSIDNDSKLDNKIFESIHDVDRPINLKTRKDRQHKYKLHNSKDEDVVLPDTSRVTKPYTGLEKTTPKTIQKTTTEHAKHHRSPKRRVGSFWRKMKGKYKKKDSKKHDFIDRKRRITHKKEPRKDSTNPGPRTKGRRKNRKKISLQQPEITVRKRDASGGFATTLCSYTPQSYKLQMGVAPQVENMPKSKYRTKTVQPFAVNMDERVSVADNLKEQLESITFKISDLKEKYDGNHPMVNKALNTELLSAEKETDKPRATTTKKIVTSTKPDFQGTAQIELMLNDMKAKAMHIVSFRKPLVTDLISNSVTEATFNSDPVLTRFGILAPGSGLSTFVSINGNENLEKATVASTKSDEFNLNDLIFSANTEAHYLAARSIKEDTMNRAQNIEDMLQKELKNIYNKVKHKVSSDLRKEIHSVKSTAKESYRKLSSKLSNKCKTTRNATRSTIHPTSTSPPKPRTCPRKSSKLKKKEQSSSSTTTATIATTAPRVKKKDDIEENKFTKETPESVYKQTYDDYMMLTLFEQMLSKTREENVRKMLATTEVPVFSKNKRKTFRLSKRNPETLTDVKLREVIQNVYDDGGNMPDYDYIDPSANASSTERTTANNNYNDADYMLDPSSTTGNSADGPMMEISAKNKGTSPAPTDVDHADHAGDAGHTTADVYNTTADSNISTADSDNTAFDTSYEGLSNKISYNEFVNGYKHYLNFQKDQINQNFSDLIKYQAHRHHNVEDIGKYILNKIPPLPSYNKKKREQRFSDDSENNVDYQEITTKSDDSWFRKHFYLFIDNGPPKKYHTSETVELKPHSTEPALLRTTEPKPGILPEDKIFISVGSDGVARKAKHTQEISLDVLSKVLDSIKDKQTGDILSNAESNTQKDIFNPINNFDVTDDATIRDKSIISKLFAGKRRYAPKKYIETTEYFPDYMFAENTRGILRRSITKDNYDNTIMADFINKDLKGKASTGTKEVLAKATRLSNKETKKYGYVDIDLVPRQTAIVKLKDNAKKSRFKNFFKKFNFKKKKPKNLKPKRSCSQNRRRERFNPIKKLKSMFKFKYENDKQKEAIAPNRLLSPDYGILNSHMSNYKPMKFSNQLSVADLEKQIPNISDIYFEPELKKSTTKLSSNYFHLDDKDQDLLYNYHPLSSSSKPSVTSQTKPAKQMMTTITRTKATPAPSASSSSTVLVSASLKPSKTKKPEIQRIPPCNVMTVNLKTMRPSTTTLISTEATSQMTLDDMSFILDKMQNKLKKDPDNFPKVNTVYNPYYVRQTGKYKYKNVQPPLPQKSPLEELLIRSKLTRIAKFPIRKRRYKKKRNDDSEIVNIGNDYLGFDGPSILEYVHDLRSRNTPSERRKSVERNTLKKSQLYQRSRANNQDKSRYTDYFNDLLMWHNDILNLDTVPNPLWANILKTVQSDTENIYTTPNVNSLLIGLKEINDYLDLGDNINKSALIISPNRSLNMETKDRIGVRQVKNHLNDQGVIRSVAMDDNAIVTSKDMIIKGEAKYYLYNKPKKFAKKLSSSDFIMKLNRLNVNNDDKQKAKVHFKRKGDRRFSPSPCNNNEPTIIVDTTLMAYDDDVASVTKTLEIKKHSRNSFNSTPTNKMVHSLFLKTNEPPMQYYTTPLPMKACDFNKFLKEHQMDVDFVTSPLLELPTIKTNGPTPKKNKGPYQNGITTIAAVSDTWKTQSVASIPSFTDTSELVTRKKIKTTTTSTKRKGFTQQLKSKIKTINKALGKSLKFTTDQPKVKPVSSSLTNNKLPYWEDDFDRYKRYSKLKLPTNAAPFKLNKATTQEVNYYSIFKKKMKERLFEKKATRPVDHSTTEPFAVDPQSKEVEITIINFDDIEKNTPNRPLDTFTFPALTREEISSFANYGDMTTPDTTVVSNQRLLKESEKHNELLYKDIFNERSTIDTTEFSTTDLAKSTEYVDPVVNDGQAVTSKKPIINQYSSEKIPMYQNILKKMPHAKNFNSGPRRVHISSHHYKYDVFYDDLKNIAKTFGIEGSVRPKHFTMARPIGMRPVKLTHERTSISGKGIKTEVVKKIDRTSYRNRYKRKLWGREVPHKIRKYYTFRKFKSKPGERLTESTVLDITADVSGKRDAEHFTSELITTALVPEKPHEEPFTSAADKTTEVSWTRDTDPMSDIKDVVTMLDSPDMGVTMSDIEDAITLSALQSEFFSSVTIRDNIRRAFLTPSTTAAPVTNALTKATKPPTKPAPKPAAKPAITVSFTPQPGSLVYHLKQLKATTTSSKPSKDKKNLVSVPKNDRHRRLFKISALLHNRFKSKMKNVTATTKRTNATTHKNTTTQSSKSMPKRTCVSIPDSPSPYDVLKQAATKTVSLALERADASEAFRVSSKPQCSSQQILMPPSQDESEDVTPASFQHHKCKSNHQICDCEVYVEPETYNDQLYYEMGPMKCPCQNTTQAPRAGYESVSHCDMKREAAQLNTFTAKDVAALEVIVDLMKNTLSYEDNNPTNVFRDSNLQHYATKPIKTNGSTNSIQVHIAIPFDFQNGKKRSPSYAGPFRLRKVFSAKMSTPVDLEYQVNSFEGTITPTSTKLTNNINSTDDALSPGMYLLIDKTRDGLALKPVLGQINLSDLKARQAAAGTTVPMTESKPIDTREETKSLKNLAKVTLSKDFVAAVNQQLIEMYENMSRVNNKNIRLARSVWKSRKLKEKNMGGKRNAEKYIVKRRIDWEAVKQFFGHDRVCSCKCQSNKTMCRACAASDAVIEELIFEFDNIGRYMADHCTEIQTYFWMNPTGGQRLRDSVNKIDKSLSDYYKRVKGKCQGRLCKTYIDKRQFIQIAKTKKKDSMSQLVNDLAILAEDLNRTISMKVCYNDKLKENGDKFLHLMNCIMTKPLNKRSKAITTPKKLISNVYSLDNINVNIICNPESSTATDEHLLSATIMSEDNSRLGDNLLNFDLEETKHKKRKGYKKLFPRKSKKSKLLSYFEFNKRSKTNYKRQVDNQVSTPLISDGGGVFWYDYLKTGTNEPRLARDSIKDTPNIEITVVQKGVTRGTDPTENPNMYMAVQTTAERNQRDIETTTDSLSGNINQMLRLFGSLQDIEAVNKNSNQTTMMLTTESVIYKALSQNKAKKESLSIVDKLKQKIDNAWSKEKATTITLPQKAKQKFKSLLDKKFEKLTTIRRNNELVTQKTAPRNSNVSKDKYTEDVILILTKVKANVTTFKTTTETPVTDKTLATTIETNDTSLATINAPKSDDKSGSTPMFGNEATMKSGFLKKLKAATLLMFRKEQNSQTSKLTTETPIETPTVLSTKLTSPTSHIIDILPGTDVDGKVMDVIEESAHRTTQNPTILIIDDYDNRISSETLNDVNKEGYRNLLLSIIQFETNNLNDEWDWVAYGRDRRRVEMDIKRSIVTTPKVESVKLPMKLTPKSKSPAEVTSEGISDDQDRTAKKPEGLLNKIVSKMGIKVEKKKKVVKKASIRDLKKERKKGNFIRNRKLRINSYRQANPTSPGSVAEACHTRRTTKPSQICDIQATYDHIQKLQESLPAKTFETLVRNITCYKYKNADPFFTIPYKRKGKRWDWIRKKRSLKLHFYNRIKDEHNFDDDAFVVNFEDDSTDSFERFAKGDDGIYKIVNRKKRTAKLEDLERGLRNIPTLMPGEEEVFVTVGDSVTLDCGLHIPVRTCDGKFNWKTDRKRMLKQDNVDMDGVSATIHNVEPRNAGTYTCSLDHTVRRNFRLNVLTVPFFDIVFLPVYKTEENCSYDDIKAIQQLGGLMANETRCGKACSIRIDEPVCQRDKGTNSSLIRATAVISVTPRELNCSLQCKRDIISSLVLLCATNTPILSSIKVLLSKDGVTETLMPWTDLVRPVVTYTLRKKDTNGHDEYHKLVPLLSLGRVDVVIICPAGYYLLPKYKLCSTCPPNTSSQAGDNTCRKCPRGTQAEPGAAQCHVSRPHQRRYDWWWYPPCGYVVACCGVLFGCSTCVLLSVIVHVVSRDAERRESADGGDDEQKILKSLPRVTVAHEHMGGARPLSPSRVILPRFFRASLTSSRATDSQETKFELWKERNRPPPLPPIDFDP